MAFHLDSIIAWCLCNTASAFGTVILILLPMIVFYWRHSINKALKQKLQVKVLRNAEKAKNAEWLKHDALLSYLNIDYEVAAQDYADLRMCSLGEYMASLDPQGTVSLQKGMISVLEANGLRVALPLALFAPPAWKKESELIGAFGNSPYASLLLSNMLSTLGLISVSVVSCRQNIEAQRYAKMIKATAADTKAEEAKKKITALDIMIQGANPEKEGDITSRFSSNMFSIPDDLPRVDTAEQDASTPLDAPTPSPIHAIFPDLASGNGGLKMSCSASQAEAAEVVAAVLNRLASNSLVGLNASPLVPDEPFVVQIAPGSTSSSKYTKVTSVEDFVQCLEDRGHTIIVEIVSNVTSFGAGLCTTDQDGGFTQIPLCYPLNTGLYARDENDGSNIDVVTLMQHAGVKLTIRGPWMSATLEWCLSIRGVTGWVAETGMIRPWANSPAVQKSHSKSYLNTSAKRTRALRLTTASAAVLNVSASHAGLLFGGYGSLGVCIDSVAAIQQVISGKCSLYPLTLGGDLKTALLYAYKKIQGLGRKNCVGGWEYDDEATILQRSIAALPCDGIPEPSLAAETAKRALACLPERCVFAGVQKCRAGLEAAIRMAESVSA